MRPVYEAPEINLKIKPIGRIMAQLAVEVLARSPGRGSLVKSHHRRAVFELSISYSFVYFTCSLTV